MGLGRWVRPDRIRRISTGGTGGQDEVAAIVAAAAGAPVLAVVRDAHRYPAARAVVAAVLTARPDTVVVEMGLPGWHPHSGAYLVTFGATRASSQAAAEALGLATDRTQEVSAHGPDRP